jgi:hypothetical protein
MIYNIGIISLSLFFQPHTAMLTQDLQAQLIPLLVRPVGVQILVAFVTWLWVKSATNAIVRADRAEMIANLEHQIGSERRSLEQGIKQILDTHVAVANGKLETRAPLNQEGSGTIENDTVFSERVFADGEAFLISIELPQRQP